jgi:hypothetical protein
MNPVFCSNSGINTSSRPESCVLVVVARIKFGLAGMAVVGTGVGAVVGMVVDVGRGGSVTTGADVGVIAGPQADRVRTEKRSKADTAIGKRCFIRRFSYSGICSPVCTVS